MFISKTIRTPSMLNSFIVAVLEMYIDTFLRVWLQKIKGFKDYAGYNDVDKTSAG